MIDSTKKLTSLGVDSPVNDPGAPDPGLAISVDEQKIDRLTSTVFVGFARHGIRFQRRLQ
ncbi:MAG: hypothetical protein R2762_02880 [Bryobacteraceae bacterium]